ncbi:B12-binding domain-containing radical SAM protein [Oligoflexaceae bacterium]|nr:B12-binding domain-containing radical SAM protein [Oligoflexaceae bacterium]
MEFSFQSDQVLKCILVHPKFSLFNYWNFVDVTEAVGAKSNQPPLGLLTVASMLPKHWELQVIDLNVRSITDEEWRTADIIATGGMLPQQGGILDIIDRANNDGKYVVVGGPDPSSQHEVYHKADAIIIGEGELTIPLWLESLFSGDGKGTFSHEEKPDVTKTPIPRFDLIDFDDYLHLGIQYSRGCPFNCEFCDIIELYGRKPRTKTPDQFIAELDAIRELGYSGWVDIVDDNFIGNKRDIKKMLPQLKTWCEEKKFPFYFSTEASMNLGDDLKLLKMMQEVDFRYVFMGIETPDPELLMATQKSQNAIHSMQFRVENVYDHGMSIAAGFIIGFDGEKKGMDESMIKCIEELGIIMSMVGLLVALPNTQLTRRLMKEKRLIDSFGQVISEERDKYVTSVRDLHFDVEDQTTGGLNYITTRDRVEILKEYQNIVKKIYHYESYFERVLRTTRKLNIKRRHKPSTKREILRSIRGFLMLVKTMTANSKTRKIFWSHLFKYILMGSDKFEFAMNMLAGYIHFEKQTAYLVQQIENRMQLNIKMKVPRVHKPDSQKVS